MRYFLVRGNAGERAAEKRVFTSSRRLHPARQTQTAESIIEYLIKFQGGRGVVRYFDAGCQAVKNPIPPQNRLRLRRYKHARLRIAKYVVLFQNTCIDMKSTIMSIFFFFNKKCKLNFIHYICV